MKKRFLLLFIFPIVGNAQEISNNSIEVSPYVGYNITNYRVGNETLSMTNHPNESYHVGVDINYFLNNRFSISGGLLYQTITSDYTVEPLIGGFSYSDRQDQLQLLQIPIIAKYHFGSTRKWNVALGPTLGFVFNGETNGVDVSDQINKAHVGLQYGIGYNFYQTNRFKIGVEYRSQFGFTPIYKEKSLVRDDFSGTLVQAFNLRAAFKL